MFMELEEVKPAKNAARPTEANRSLEEIATEIADAIANARMTKTRTVKILLEFAEEIKRQSIEP